MGINVLPIGIRTIRGWQRSRTHLRLSPSHERASNPTKRTAISLMPHDVGPIEAWFKPYRFSRLRFARRFKYARYAR